MADRGTGVFILGFDPQAADKEWVAEMLKAIVENFFYAIHNKALVVGIVSRSGGTESITHETIDAHFSRLYGDKPPDAYFYHKAISSVGVPKRISVGGGLGDIHLYLLLDQGPKRIAYINRMGMLISDSREQSVNPVSTRARALWPDFAAVVVPSSPKGDKWSRQMENPSHDAVSPHKLPPKERRKASETFREARRLIRDGIDDTVGSAEHDGESNIRELSKILPDEFDPDRPGNTQLVSREDKPPSNRMEEVIDVSDEDDRIDDTDDVLTDDESPRGPGPRRRKGKEGRKGKGPGPSPMPRANLENVRFIATGEQECIVAFSLREPVKHVSIELKPAGVEPGREDPIVITSASLNGRGGSKRPTLNHS